MKVKVHGQGHEVKKLVPTERSCHKEYTHWTLKYLSLMVHKLWPRLLFLPKTDRQTDRQTGQKLDGA